MRGVKASRTIKCAQLFDRYTQSSAMRENEYMAPDSMTTPMTGLSELSVWRNFPAARSTDHMRYAIRPANATQHNLASGEYIENLGVV